MTDIPELTSQQMSRAISARARSQVGQDNDEVAAAAAEDQALACGQSSG